MERIVPDGVFDYIHEQAQNHSLQPTEGDCAEIALAIDEVFGGRYGGEIQGVFTPDERTPLHFAVALSDGTIVDGLGLRTEAELLDEFDIPPEKGEIRPVFPEDVEQYVQWSLFDRLVQKFETIHQNKITSNNTDHQKRTNQTERTTHVV
mgnify:CR=1 FL=1